MSERPPLEDRVAELISGYADRAPTRVDPIAMTRLAVAGSGHSPSWFGFAPVGRGLAFALVLIALLAAIMSGALIAGAQPFRPDPVQILTERAFVEPFIGLPPDGTAPSVPETGELVLSFGGRVTSLGGDFHRMWLYADGRLLWRSNLEPHDMGAKSAWRLRFGGTKPSRAVIEQHLTPEGVNLMRAEVMGSARVLGLARVGDDVIEWGRPGTIWGGMLLGDGDRVLEATWSDRHLPGRLAHPGSWLPESAWADRRIAGFVPSRYAVCVEPPRVDLLPESTKDLLHSRATRVDDPRCPYRLTTEDARAIVATLDEAGLQQPDRGDPLRYPLPIDLPEPEHPFVEVLPVVPDGDVVCSCG